MCQQTDRPEAFCFDCKRPYGDEHGFSDFLIPHEQWKIIAPNGDDAGLLCACCICKRLHDAGMHHIEGSFLSGPVESVSRPLMSTILGLEGLQLAIRGRENYWNTELRKIVRDEIDAQGSEEEPRFHNPPQRVVGHSYPVGPRVKAPPFRIEED